MVTGFILQPTYRIRSGVPVVQLYGRLEGGEPFLVEDDRFRPYLFAAPRAVEELAMRRGIRISETELRDLRGEPVVRIEVETPGEIPIIRDRLVDRGIPALESDVRFPYRYLIDHDILATLAIHGESERVPLGAGAPDLLLFKNPAIEAADARPELTTLSIDIETSADAKLVFSVSLVGCGGEEVLLIAERPVHGATVVADEAELLLLTLERIRALDPDVLLGWAVVDFDLRVLANRAEAHRIPFFLGRTNETVRFQRDPGFTRQSRAEVPGRMVLDGIPLVRDALRLPDYRLETVGQHVLGRGKKIDQTAPNKAQEIFRMWREDPESLAAYNLEDARLVPEILEHEGLLQLTCERSRLAGMQLDRVGASIASFDRVYLPELRRRGLVAPSVDSERKSARIQGGALLEPDPGIYRNVAVLDFKSLYPSLIRTFHLDPLAHARAAESDPAAPNGARFSRDEAILPDVIRHFMERRDAAKARGDRHADQAIKLMMNAMFGVLGAASCRFFDPDIANAITGFGQQTLHWTRDAFEETGHRVLYGDTDSVFVELPEGLEALRAHALALELRERVENRIAERIRDTYGLEPQLVLELEKIFTRLMLPRVRSGRSGSKKRYAGWIGSKDDGELVIVGLESVRRDWPDVAHRLQQGMLERLFTDREVVPFVAQLVKQVRAGTLDSELIYAKRLRKGALDNYKTNAPHVVAARKLGRRVGSTIRYVITRRGPEPTPPGTTIPEDLDRSHYVEKVLRPVAEAIFELTDHSFDEAIGNPTQMRLLC
ncbi:MAG: DNA polymerase II [bacterium]|nr:DNA polymerase II [bacterium]